MQVFSMFFRSNVNKTDEMLITFVYFQDKESYASV